MRWFHLQHQVPDIRQGTLFGVHLCRCLHARYQDENHRGIQNETVPAGVVGNLEISGPVVFKSYFNNPTATEESFSSDGWFKTGDKGSIDETGYLTLQGRAKEAMIINGVK